MSSITAEEAKALAPDLASLKAAQELADICHWVSLGANEAALWGECKGSAQKPYKVQVDLSNRGFACTCPSRKSPCKHVLGLMLLASASPTILKDTTPPAWVSEWLEKRTDQTSDHARQAEPDTASSQSRQKDAARRAARREKLVAAGLETLDLWLKDLIRQGLAFAQSAPASFWEQQSARLVDAQLPGAARMVREMQGIPGASPNWAEILLLKMARLQLLIQAYRRLESLPEPSRTDVRTLLGWTINRKELIHSSPALSDDWLVVAQTLEEDETSGLRTQINWLWGKTSRKPAQLILFAFRTRPFEDHLFPGLTLRGDLVYFPGAYPLRAVFKSYRGLESTFVPAGFPNILAFLDAYSTALGLNPWLEHFPVVLEHVTIEKLETNWLLCDGENQAIPVSPRSPCWELLSLSGGHPLTVFGLWDGFAFFPMTAWENERFVRL
ncbi:SWIM zinc finger family protein [Roseiflexus sp.]|jgi:hypothetical protein